MPVFSRALSSSDGLTRAALNAELPANNSAPDWIELIPAGPAINGRDGRQWLLDDDARNDVLETFRSRNTQSPIDWEHASERRAHNGEEAPAAGWVDRLEDRGGAIWGHVQWTPRAKNQIENREYRFISPVFDFDPRTGRIARFVSAGLTNQPNLSLTALNREETPRSTNPQEKSNVNIPKAVADALGVAEDADVETVVAAVNKLKSDVSRAENAERHPSLERFVPRGDFDAMQTRATNAEQALQAEKTKQHQAAVDAAIEDAVKGGKITPATADYHRAACKEDGGLERFKKYVESSPVIAPDSGLDGKNANETSRALNDEEKAAARALGIPEDQFIKGRQ